MTLEQIKALGRAEILGVKQELAAEKERERQRPVQLEKERSKGDPEGRDAFLGIILNQSASNSQRHVAPSRKLKDPRG